MAEAMATTQPVPPTHDPWRVLTEEKRKVILAYLKDGESRREACGLARIKMKTFERALERGDKDLEDYEEYGCPLTLHAKFAQDVRYAEAAAKRSYRKKLEKVSSDDPRNWAAEFTFLERTQPEAYGRKSTISVQQEQAVKVIFEERGGNEWQGVRGVGQKQLTSADVVDTVIRETEDEDN